MVDGQEKALLGVLFPFPRVKSLEKNEEIPEKMKKKEEFFECFWMVLRVGWGEVVVMVAESWRNTTYFL